MGRVASPWQAAHFDPAKIQTPQRNDIKLGTCRYMTEGSAPMSHLVNIRIAGASQQNGDLTPFGDFS